MKLEILSKLNVFAILILPLTVITSCKKTDTLVQVNVPLQMAQISYTIPMNQTSIDTTISVYCNVDSIIRASNANSFNISNIKSVTATSANTILTGTTDVADNFGNLSSLSIAISSISDTTATIFAQVTNNPGTFATSLNIPVNDTVNLKNYFDATLFNFTLRSTLTTPTTIALQAQATIQFNIVVGPN
jgi:hypothetical protein